jgi:hypothetical protein
MALSLAINLARLMTSMRRTMEASTTPVRTRNVSQSVSCRVVGMTWVINAAWYPLLSCKLALRGNIMLGHVTIVSILFGIVMDDVILVSTRICGFTTH